MKFSGKFSGSRNGAYRIVAGLWMALALALSPQAVAAQSAPVPAPIAPTEQTPDAPIDEAAAEAGTAAVEASQPAAAADSAAQSTATAGSYIPMKPTEGKGMPTPGGLTFQDQYSEDGKYALWMHDAILLPVITIISLFVLFLMMWTMVRYRRARNPKPSRTTHNTLIEVVWTVVPAFILLLIAVPSITLLAKQYKTPPKDAITIKVTGYQWYWGYSYPDNGDFEIVSNMLDKEEADARGEPHQLAVDNRMVVPAGVPLRIQVTAADVIHSFAVPSLWFKIDAVPGRLNERLLTIEEPGVYYGQCSELCGVRHGYMPIAVEALPMAQYNAWVLAQGGQLAGAEEEAAATPAPAATTAPAETAPATDEAPTA